MTAHRDLVRGQRAASGTITPSGNVVVERVTQAVLRDFPDVSGHFSRTEVVGVSDNASADYDWVGMLGAAELLSHAAPGCIVWNGSKGGSIDFAIDHELCARIQSQTGIPATTSTLAIDAVLRATGVRRIGLVTPYRARYAGTIPPVFARAGYTTIAEAHASVADNLAYAAVPDADIEAMVRQVAMSRPDAIITYCTNFPAAHLVDALERALGVPIYDSVTAGVWGALCRIGVPTAAGRAWGSLFDHTMR
jgi:maleate isomerase